MPVPGDIGREHTDLTVGDLAGRARVLAPHPAGGPPLLEKAGLVYDQHRTRIGQGLKGIVAHQIAQRLGVPLSFHLRSAPGWMKRVWWVWPAWRSVLSWCDRAR